MDHDEQRPPLGNGYYLDLVNESGSIVLRKEDGTEAARFSVWDASSEAIERAAREDLRKNQQG